MILLSLIGEQPIPNLLPLWYSQKYTATQFAATRTTMPVARSLEAAIQRDPALRRLSVLPPIELQAYDIGAARAALSEALVQHRSQDQEVTINLTGGTKLMSLAALQAAFGSGVPLLYVSTEQNQFINLASDASELSREPIRVNISVEQYLGAHGLEMSDNKSFNPHRGRDAHNDLAGDELEERLEAAARESGNFDDVRRGIYIRKRTERGEVINELDLVVTHNGRMAVCSCKSGKSATKEAIYELASLSRREAAGIYCGKVLVTDLESLTQPLRERARSMGVRLIYGAELANAAQHLLGAVS